jgi:hypothetical protein
MLHLTRGQLLSATARILLVNLVTSLSFLYSLMNILIPSLDGQYYAPVGLCLIYEMNFWNFTDGHVYIGSISHDIAPFIEHV